MVGPETRRAAAMGALAIVGLACTLALPWLAYPETDPGNPTMWWDLATARSTPYEKTLIWAPPLAFLVALLCAATAGLARSPATARVRAVETVAGLAWFAVALCAARWLGFYEARLLDAGPTLIHLHAAPWTQAAAGAFGLAGALRGGRWRRLWHLLAGRVAVVAGLGLLTLPLLPMAVAAGGAGRFHYDELTLEVLRAAQAPGSQAARWMAWGRWVLFAGLALGLAGVARRARPGGRPSVILMVGTLALGALALLFQVRFYVASAETEALRAGYNPLLGLVGLALVVAAGAMLRTRKHRQTPAIQAPSRR